jgi:hypothetical protein
MNKISQYLLLFVKPESKAGKKRSEEGEKNEGVDRKI